MLIVSQQNFEDHKFDYKMALESTSEKVKNLKFLGEGHAPSDSSFKTCTGHCSPFPASIVIEWERKKHFSRVPTHERLCYTFNDYNFSPIGICIIEEGLVQLWRTNFAQNYLHYIIITKKKKAFTLGSVLYSVGSKKKIQLPSKHFQTHSHDHVKNLNHGWLFLLIYPANRLWVSHESD